MLELYLGHYYVEFKENHWNLEGFLHVGVVFLDVGVGY